MVLSKTLSSEHLDISVADLASNMIKAPTTYKVYTIPKRTGGKRVIAQPTKFVKNVQRGVVSLLLNNFEVLDSTMAYVKGKSIVDNANTHLGCDFILKMDFENFFPSITSNDFLTFISQNKVILPRFEQVFLSHYLFRKTNTGFNLSIGAPSSPMISNIIMFDIDNVIRDYCG